MMSENESSNATPANITPEKRVSGLWLIPLLTVAVGAWMIYDNWASQGPLITIEFETAEGLEAGKTLIKTREVQVGLVEDITLNANLDGVLVSARINREFRDLLVEGSRFWVVQPEVTLSGVTGLGTLISGQYIRFSPEQDGQLSDYFKGLEQPPLTPLGTPGLRVTLTNIGDYTFTRGDRIEYYGITVGTIEDVEFNFEENQVYYNAFIQAPYHELITSNTRFWKASGIHAEFNGAGFTLDIGSVRTLISEGISFSIPDGQFQGDTATESALYYIYPSRAAINEQLYIYSLRYWVMVNSGIGGLSVGAPVSHRGVQIGKVLRTDYIPEGQTLLNKDMPIPVLIEINPGRLGLPDTEQSLQRASADINNWISEGLIATIRTQNFILGQQSIDLAYDESFANTELQTFTDLVVIPTGEDTLQKFADGIERLITKINELPIEELIADLQDLLAEGSDTLAAVQELSATGNEFFNNSRNAELVEQTTQTMRSFEQLASGFSSESQTNQEILKLMQSLTGLVEEFRPLVNDIKNTPNSLVFPVQTEDELTPARKAQ